MMVRIASAFFSLLGLLPFWMLYGFSDILYVLMCLVGYRRHVITENLSHAFPQMGFLEIGRTRRRFYRRLTDYFVETIKLSHISDRSMRRHMRFENPELIDGLLARGRSVAVYFSHSFNWEWAPSVTLWSRYAHDPKVAFCQVYRPLSNDVADSWFLKLRSRFGARSIAKSHVMRALMTITRREGRLTVTGFMADQRPSHQDPIFSVDFLGRPTLVITGTETLARRLGQACVYWDISRLKRGRYSITTRMIAERPDELPEHEVTRRYFNMLEATIRRDPPNWLWSHKRWRRYRCQQEASKADDNR